MCTNLIETHATKAFVSCLLIPLDKNPGLWTIGIGEVLRRISDKVIISIPKEYDIKGSGTLQVAGQEGNIEAAIHIKCKWCMKMKTLMRFY